MSDNITFVTALYFSQPTSRMGGRGWCLDFWKAPFKNILSMNIPLVIYTDDYNDQATRLESFLKEENYTKYKIIKRKLEDFSLSEKIFNLKEQANIIDDKGLKEGVSTIANQRNYHLCLQKIFWLNEQASINPFSSTKFYWIDFGLFHHTIFPDSLGGMEKLIKIDKSKYWPENKDNMFSPVLAEKLFNYSEDKFFCIIHENEPIQYQAYSLFPDSKPHSGYIIGGLFGGTIDIIGFIFEKFNHVMQVVYENNMLLLEEPILSIVYSNNVDKCKTLSFVNWYHDCPGGAIDRCNYGITSDVRSFYKVFYNDLLGLYKTPNP